MNRKWIVPCSSGLIVALILLVLWMSIDHESPVALGVSISQSDGEQAVLFKASITNQTRRVVKINGRVQVMYLDEAGREEAVDFVRLAGSGMDMRGLQPRSFDYLVLMASRSDHITGVRLRFNYNYDAGPLPRAVSRALKGMRIGPPTGMYPLNGCWGWLNRKGFLDGKRKGSYQGTWGGDTKAPPVANVFKRLK